MKVIYLNVEGFEMPKVMDIPQDLSTFCELIHTNAVEVVHRKIGMGVYAIIIDKKAFFKRNQVVSFTGKRVSDTLVGNLIITSYNENGKFVGLSDDDLREVMGHFPKCLNADSGKEYYMLRGD